MHFLGELNGINFLRSRKVKLLAVFLLSLLILSLFSLCIKGKEAEHAESMEINISAEKHISPVFLPGTQPHDIAQPIASPESCKPCHGAYADYSPYDTWKGSMMSLAMLDPLFLALNAISNKDLEGVVDVGDYCLRCHAPTPWLEGRSVPVDGSAMTKSDIEQGVSCDFCHRLVDPLSDEGKALVINKVTTHGNSQYVVDHEYVRRGPYEDAQAPHKTKYSEFHTKSEICGTCHDILNPVYDLKTPVERTYTEWKYSAFAEEDIECQDCHMPDVKGYAAYAGNIKLRDNVYKHEFVGGSYCVQDMILYLYPELSEDRKEAIKKAKKLAKEMLRSAAELEARAENGKLEVKITNLAGHKLPTGYPEGRRMWINVKFFDKNGNLIKESGKYDYENAELVHDPEIKVYEAKPGMKDVEGYEDGESFHFALNNYIYKDNRIPPRGFKKDAYERELAFIRGADYKDGQNWDTTEYAIPENAAYAEVKLYYQSMSKEFIEFLKKENENNSWDYFKAGEKVYEAWLKTGKCPPAEIASLRIKF